MNSFTVSGAMISMTTDKKSEASSPSNATATGSTSAASSSSARVAQSSSTKTKLSLRSSLTKPASSRQQRAKRAKVSFSQEVISKDDNGGDGSKVVIKEEHGIFLGPLLGRMTMSSSDTETEDEGDNAKDGSAAAKTASAPVISFAMDGHTSENLSYSESSNGILKSSNNGSSQLSGDGNVEYDNLVVHMGLLKCGHRYRAVIPVPDYWKQNNASEGANTANALGRDDDTEEIQATKTNESYAMNVRMVEESLDNDLRGEIQKEFINNRSAEDTGPANRHHVSITLSARQQRGQYRGRFVLELTHRASRCS